MEDVRLDPGKENAPCPSKPISQAPATLPEPCPSATLCCDAWNDTCKTRIANGDSTMSATYSANLAYRNAMLTPIVRQLTPPPFRNLRFSTKVLQTITACISDQFSPQAAKVADTGVTSCNCSGIFSS
jgi:hypothetical protein